MDMGYVSDPVKSAKVTKTFSKKLNISGINEIKKFIIWVNGTGKGTEWKVMYHN